MDFFLFVNKDTEAHSQHFARLLSWVRYREISFLPIVKKFRCAVNILFVLETFEAAQQQHPLLNLVQLSLFNCMLVRAFALFLFNP